MTFILGLMCQDGLVICSDSQEQDGISKRNVKKLHQFEVENWGIAWGCAGDSDVISKFTKHLRRVLSNEKENSDLIRLQELTESVGSSIKNDYSKASLSFVCGLWAKNKNHIPEISLCSMDIRVNTCLAIHDDYACTGMDTSLALFVLNSLHSPALNLRQGVTEAIFSTKLMKDTAEGVGGPTQLISCSKNPFSCGWKTHEDKTIRKQEGKYSSNSFSRLLRKYWAQKNPSWRSFLDTVETDYIIDN